MLHDQLVLSYPPLPEGVKQRNLKEIDPAARAGKNAYWINMSNLKDETLARCSDAHSTQID